MLRIYDPEIDYKNVASAKLWYRSTLISLIVCHYFKIHIIIFSLPVPSTLIFQNTDGRVKVKHGTKNNNISIEKKVMGSNHNLPTIYIYITQL